MDTREYDVSESEARGDGEVKGGTDLMGEHFSDCRFFLQPIMVINAH
jgi:hypothetical protein